MKVYKFRGKCKDTNEYVTGDLIRISNVPFIFSQTSWKEYYNINDGGKYFKIFTENASSIKYRMACKVYPVYEDTVAQFVGYDKNGNEIYDDMVVGKE